MRGSQLELPGIAEYATRISCRGSSTESEASLEPQTFFDSNGIEVSFSDPASSENRRFPMHRWVPWIAGFSADFVQSVLREYLDDRHGLVLDPFAGVGTTLIEGHMAGHDVAGFEINPFACLAMRAKLESSSVDLRLLSDFTRRFIAFMQEKETEIDAAWRGGHLAELERPPVDAPPGFRTRIPFYNPPIEAKVLWAISFFRTIPQCDIARLFWTAFGTAMVGFSNYSYEPSLSSRPASDKPLIANTSVGHAVAAKLEIMIQDLGFLRDSIGPNGQQPKAQIIEDTFFHAESYLDVSTIDLLITSPPYLNNYHYVRNTRPQLFWLGFVDQPKQLKRFETESFGKFWQTVRDRTPLPLEVSTNGLSGLVQTIRNIRPHRGAYGGPGWANYVTAYFNDSYRFLRLTQRFLKPGAVAVIVVGNSMIQGVEIKVEEILGSMAESLGMVVEGLPILRAKRVGSSIVGSDIRSTPLRQRVQLYDAAVVLRKPR